jgi:hypothetical protein
MMTQKNPRRDSRQRHRWIGPGVPRRPSGNGGRGAKVADYSKPKFGLMTAPDLRSKTKRGKECRERRNFHEKSPQEPHYADYKYLSFRLGRTPSASLTFLLKIEICFPNFQVPPGEMLWHHKPEMPPAKRSIVSL